MSLSASGTETGDPAAERREQALHVVDSQLYRKAQGLIGTLRPNHYARLSAWRLPLRPRAGALFRHTREEFAQLDPIGRFVEMSRAESEALLVHECLGHVLLNDNEREDLLLRALGILPDDEAIRFAEIATLHDISPKHILIDPAHFLAGLKGIEANYGTSSALAYGLLLIVGVRSTPEMIKYGAMLQMLFDQVTLAPAVARTLSRVGEKPLTRAAFDLQFSILTQVREQLLQSRDWHPGREFRFNRILEYALQQGKGVVTTGDTPNALGWVALDAVILTKLLFPVRLVAVDSSLYLEVALGSQQVYWESATPAPLSHVPVQAGVKADVFDLFPRTYHEIGVWNSRQGQINRAVTALKQALMLKPNLPETYHELGLLYLRTNEPNEAVEASQQAVALEPRFAEAYVALGSALIMRHQPEAAIEALKTAIRIKPNLAEAFNNLGFAYEQQGELERAIVAFQAAIRIRPEYAQAHYNLGNAYLAANKTKAAIAAYQKTARVNPDFVRAYYNLGQAYYQEGMLDDAVEAYKRVLRINPRHAGALYNLGIVYRDKGLKAKAVATIEAAVKINPNLLR